MGKTADYPKYLEKYMINRNDDFKGNIYPLSSIFSHLQLKRS